MMISNVDPENIGWGSKKWSFTREEFGEFKFLFDSYKKRGKGNQWILADALDMEIFKHENTDPSFVARLIDRVEKGEEIFENGSHT